MKFLKLLCLFLCTFSALAQTKQHSFLDDSASVEVWLNEKKVPALGIGTIKDGEINEITVYGEIKEGVKAPKNTLFNVASLAKPIVSMLTLKLVEMGEWDLDEPLKKYWVDPDVGEHPYTNILSTRHVLSHRTGFRNWRWEYEDKKLAFDFEPGTKHNYSGEGFEYLQKALENKFQKGLDELAKEYIFKPLEMNDTFFNWNTGIDESRFAVWHNSDGENTYPTHKNIRTSAADDLVTTVEDYTKFGIYVLSKIHSDNPLYQEMVKPLYPDEKFKMGLGWEILPDLKQGQKAVLHGGGDVGVRTLIMLLPDTKEGLIIFSNGDNGSQLNKVLIERHLSLGIEIMASEQ
ncbi:serine hydrolase domain-containing protein [Sediminitomix flava]|nr:serine hydrolase domain-containing protein [Sediminitomix flava]